MAEHFFDTNVLLHLLSEDPAKADVAEAALGRGGHLSVQVLNEFTAVARRKARLAWSEVDEVLDPVRSVCTVHPLTSETYDRARHLAERHLLGVWDAVIVASALIARCTVLLTEDLQHGQKFEGLTVRNPFRSVA
ncbi:MAG TPA: PIN domain-containing protein [Myxococcaceae bacterium]|nr:PIN domain-containing protein [Myxococcaceae bacterium]